jgi:hypothetical protein
MGAESLAYKTARILERARRKLLGEDATISLFDRTGTLLVTITASFFVERQTSVVLGESWLEAEIAELSWPTGAVQLTQTHAMTAVKAGYGGAEFSASQDEDPLSAERAWKFRLTPLKRKQA